MQSDIKTLVIVLNEMRADKAVHSRIPMRHKAAFFASFRKCSREVLSYVITRICKNQLKNSFFVVLRIFTTVMFEIQK